MCIYIYYIYKYMFLIFLIYIYIYINYKDFKNMIIDTLNKHTC